MERVLQLVLCICLAAMLFTITLVVYGIGIFFGLCTWSPQMVTIVGLNNLMVAAVLWMFWD